MMVIFEAVTCYNCLRYLFRGRQSLQIRVHKEILPFVFRRIVRFCESYINNPSSNFKVRTFSEKVAPSKRSCQASINVINADTIIGCELNMTHLSN